MEEFEARSRGKINLVYEDPGEDEEKRKQATSLGIQEVQLQEATEQGMQIKKGFFGLAILYGDKKEVIPVLSDVQSFEYDLIVNIKKLTGSSKKIGIIEGSSGNKLTFTVPGNPPNTTTGFNENFPTLKQELEKLYQIDMLDPVNSSIDTSVDLLLVVAPKKLSDKEKFHIDQFLMRGKSVFFMTPGVDVNLSYGINGSAANNNYEDLLTHYGITVKKNVLLEPQNFQMVRFGNSFFPSPYPYWIIVGGENLNLENAITAKLGAMSFPWVSSLELDTAGADTSVETHVLATSSEESWAESGNFNLLPKDLNEFMPVGQQSYPISVLKSGSFESFYANNPPPSDSANPIDPQTVLNSTEGKGRVLVVANALFATDFYVGYTNATTNWHFVLNSVDQLALDPDLISIRSREMANRPIEPEKKDDKVPLLVANMTLSPLLLLIAGLLVFFNRRRRES